MFILYNHGDTSQALPGDVDIQGMARQSLNLPYIILSGVLLAAIIAFFAVFQPQYTQLRERQGALAATQAHVAEKERFLLSVDRKKVELAGAAQHEQQLAVVLPADEALKDVVRLVQRDAQAAGIVVTAITNSGDTERNRLRALKARGIAVDLPSNTVSLLLGIEAAGTYQQVRTFIEALERSPRLMDVMSLKFDRNASNAEQLNIELQLRVYHHQASDDNG